MAVRINRIGSLASTLIFVFSLTLPVLPVWAQRSPDRFLERMDRDGDGKVSADEYRGRRRPFSFFDRDGDGFATRAEIEAAMGGESRGRSQGPSNQRQASGSEGIPTRELPGQVPAAAIDRETMCAVGRGRQCDIKLAIGRGLFETGLRPRFPDGLDCRDIDENWAISYTHKRDRESYHGGIDMPAPFGTPIIAAAAGTVVAIYQGERSMRGIEVILRHGPADTGIPLWIYTQYGHLNDMPSLSIGQRVHMGQVLGPTGNSGTTPSGRKRRGQRRPAIHFAAWFSKNPAYMVDGRRLVPADGQWMDPVALYRKTPPFDSGAMKALAEAEKTVPIPVMLSDGSTIPAATKLLWPYRCTRG